MKRYETLAAEISTLIERGTLQPGSRIPSVRDTARQHALSADTVYRAFYLLEGQGLIHARPRSGYFVSSSPLNAVPAAPPSAAAPVAKAARHDAAGRCVDTFILSVYERLLDPATLPFGASYPGTGLYPYASLARSLAAAARTLKPSLFNSGLSNGYEQLREQIAQRYRSRGTAIGMDQIVITSGASEALALSLQCVTRPGDLVVVEAPCFYGTLHLLERLRLQHLAIPVDPAGGLALDALETALQRRPVKACLLMTSLQHPTGASLSEPRKQALVRLLARYGVPLVEDDVYAELDFSQIPRFPALAYDTAGTTLSCGSFSKSLAPGYRIGWVAAPGPFIERIRHLRLTTTITPSVPIQAGLSHYLQRGGYDRHLRRLRSALKQQQQRMLELVEELFPEECRTIAPPGGYYLWLGLPRGRSAWRIAQRALGEGISVMPGCVFARQDDFDGFLRLNYGHPWNERLERGMQTLGETIGAA